MGLFQQPDIKNLWPRTRSNGRRGRHLNGAINRGDAGNRGSRFSNWGTSRYRSDRSENRSSSRRCRSYPRRISRQESGKIGLEKIDSGSYETRWHGQQSWSAKAIGEGTQLTGDPNDSASMNIWLHKEVLRKLAENGGKVPPELLT